MVITKIDFQKKNTKYKIYKIYKNTTTRNTKLNSRLVWTSAQIKTVHGGRISKKGTFTLLGKQEKKKF